MPIAYLSEGLKKFGSLSELLVIVNVSLSNVTITYRTQSARGMYEEVEKLSIVFLVGVRQACKRPSMCYGMNRLDCEFRFRLQCGIDERRMQA